MDNTSNYQQDESSWIPTIEEQRRDPSLQVCLGCGQWFSAKSEICTCWTKSDHQRRKITVDEFRSMLDRLVMLRDDDDDDDESDEKRFNGHAPMFEPTPEEVDSVLNDVFTAMDAAAAAHDQMTSSASVGPIDDDDEPNPLAWAEEAGLVNPVTCPYCGAVDYVTDDELAQYNAYALDLPCSQCGRVHSK